jgi:penicillin-binding protein 2
MDFSDRKLVLIVIVLFVGITFILRLFFIQVVDDEWRRKAANISERTITVFPSRGLIYDRNQKLMVANIAVYDLMVVPKDVKLADTNAFCKLIGISKEDLITRFNAAKKFSIYKPTVFEKQIPSKDFAPIAEKLHNYKGFYAESRTLRYYPDTVGGHLLGYISEVTPATIAKNPYYKPGDYIGVNGMEAIYEKELRGQRGVKYIVVDVHNNQKGGYKEGIYDTLAIAGKNLTSSIDLELQKYGERLMQNKRGSIVAIEPSTGEILCLVNNPRYDPNLLVGRVRNENYLRLSKDTLKPLFNRALMARYPPGSTFKLMNGMIGLQEGTLTEGTSYGCARGYAYSGRKLGCHAHSSPLSLLPAIQTSCNAYFCHVFKHILDKYPTTEEGYNVWKHHVNSFGIGSKLHTDLTSEVGGFVPLSTYYDKYHGQGKWSPNTIISLAIGQGELGVTPLQMANYTAAIANRGWWITPHSVKMIDGKPITDSIYTAKHQTTIDAKNFELIVQGMFQVIEGGTGRGVRFTDSIEVCGKTGTAQNPHGKDHSIFIAFAPRVNPKIAIAVYIENVGFGATWAAPITSLMLEKYLIRSDTTTRPLIEQKMLKANLL